MITLELFSNLSELFHSVYHSTPNFYSDTLEANAAGYLKMLMVIAAVFCFGYFSDTPTERRSKCGSCEGTIQLNRKRGKHIQRRTELLSSIVSGRYFVIEINLV